MSLRDQINDELKAAMRSGDARRRDALRLLTAALKQKEVDERKTLADADVVGVIEKMIKQRRDSIAQFEQGGRADLAERENYEISVLEHYMPQALSEADIEAAIAAVIAEVGASAPADMGKVMGPLKARLAGRADMGKVSARVKSRLAG
ncbi:MAG TPA: GatB/YqeY domain-containing protein [Burkholderiales bacterium]|nr:GatB/YqeY domain-containing protein [Burkholderiales bacterium]